MRCFKAQVCSTIITIQKVSIVAGSKMLWEYLTVCSKQEQERNQNNSKPGWGRQVTLHTRTAPRARFCFFKPWSTPMKNLGKIYSEVDNKSIFSKKKTRGVSLKYNLKKNVWNFLNISFWPLFFILKISKFFF